MLVLALETSTRRGSVALVESGRLLAESWHDEPQAHGERLLGLVDRVFNEARRSLAEVGCVAAGRGPGAFTGLRVGIALALGIATGLRVPAVGVCSMRAMAMGLPPSVKGNRWPILDARRGELFVACYGEDGCELLAPRAVARETIGKSLGQLRGELPHRTDTEHLLGRVVAEFSELASSVRGFQPHFAEETDSPGAAAVGRIASLAEQFAPLKPEYHRDADAVVPHLPPSPLTQPRSY